VGQSSNNDGITVQPVAVPPPTVESLERLGYHAKPTRLVLTFSSALDPTRAQDIRNYTLVPINSKGQVGKPIPIVSAAYSLITLTVTLHPAHRLYLFAYYKLVVNGTDPSGLASPSGVLLDGQGNGVPGSDYVRVFGPSILAQPHPPLPGATRSDLAPSKSTATRLLAGARQSPPPSSPTRGAKRIAPQQEQRWSR
jgi:hypothetical protein